MTSFLNDGEKKSKKSHCQNEISQIDANVVFNQVDTNCQEIEQMLHSTQEAPIDTTRYVIHIYFNGIFLNYSIVNPLLYIEDGYLYSVIFSHFYSSLSEVDFIIELY